MDETIRVAGQMSAPLIAVDHGVGEAVARRVEGELGCLRGTQSVCLMEIRAGADPAWMVGHGD